MPTIAYGSPCELGHYLTLVFEPESPTSSFLFLSIGLALSVDIPFLVTNPSDSDNTDS